MTTKSKHDILTESELSDFKLSHRVMQCIDHCALDLAFPARICVCLTGVAGGEGPY